MRVGKLEKTWAERPWAADVVVSLTGGRGVPPGAAGEGVPVFPFVAREREPRSVRGRSTSAPMVHRVVVLMGPA